MSKKEFFEKKFNIPRVFIYGALGVLFVLGTGLFWRVLSLRNETVQVIFLDVGQGDAILVQKGEKQILLDGGKDGKLILEKLGSHMPFWDRTIEAVIATHPDQDHIAGLLDVLDSYRVQAVLSSAAKSDSRTFASFEKALSAEQAKLLKQQDEARFVLAEDVFLETFGPVATQGADSNAQSVAARLVVRDTKFLLLGDLPAKEEDSLAQNVQIKADVLKVSHHGSKYSTSASFLETVGARDAVISVGARNSYGHPDADVLSRLKEQGMRILRTDEKGDVLYECTALPKECSVKTQK